MSAVSNVLIVGAGLTGLSSAIALRQAGIDMELIERSPTRAVLAGMWAARRGRIITVTSMNGVVAMPFSDAYNAAGSPSRA
jgi:2-polyprenyl-6-methoxyphenol hydroxylase-like FAD-dependent oxidoreductase